MSHRIYLALGIFFALFLGSTTVSGNDAPAYDYIGFHLNALNQLRLENGLQPVAYNPMLETAAMVQAEWMVRHWSYAHFHGGSRPSTRARDAGYVDYEFCCGENTFLSPDITPDAAMRFWKRSWAHYHQMLNPDFTDIGVGYYIGTERTGQVIVFAVRPDPSAPQPPPAASTSTPQATTGNAVQSIAVGTGDCPVTHTIQNGENLFRISLRYNVSMTMIANRNGITNYAHIQVGDVLCIPATSGNVIDVDTSRTSTASSNANFTDNWCYAGQPWGDGRCMIPGDPYAQELMWRCGWYKAHNIETEECR